MLKILEGHYSKWIGGVWSKSNYSVVFFLTAINWPSFKPIDKIPTEISFWEVSMLKISKSHNSQIWRNSFRSYSVNRLIILVSWQSFKSLLKYYHVFMRFYKRVQKLYKRTTFVTSCLFPEWMKPFQNEATFKGNDLLLGEGTNYFLYRLDQHHGAKIAVLLLLPHVHMSIYVKPR